MEQQPNHIDLLMRQRLADASVAPPAFVWPNVERELQKKKRRLLFFWFLAAGIAGLSLYSLIQWQHRTNASGAALHSNATLPDQSKHLSQQEGAGNPGPAQPSVEKSGVVKNDVVKTADKFSSVNKKTVSEKKSTETSAQLHEQQQSNAANTHHFSMRDGSMQTSPAQTLTTVSSPENNTSDHNLAVSTPEKAGVIIKQAIDVSAATENSTTIPDNKINRNAYRSLTLLPQSGASLSYRNGIQPNTVTFKPIIRKQKDTKNCYDFNRQSVVLLVDAYGGPSFTRKSLAVSDTEHGIYRDQRLHTERKDWAYNAGIRASIMLEQHILLRTGLHYDQFTEVFEFIDPNYLHYIIDVTYANGHEIRDTLGWDYGENYVKTYNRFGMLDIPLQAGVELRSGRSGVSINAGASVNVLFWKRGAILSPQGDPTFFTPSHKDNMIVFRDRVGLSAMASVQWFYHLSPRWRVFAEPYYRQTLRPVTITTYPVEQRYSIWGVRMGVTKIID